ncbi:CIC11C00000003510 [Sungouiella intermedia]|uniref:CIC11C00000003510 n=1 Tax=Sungouiella intermedia TaxID=45354 RepID=A0A1L0BX79_9ASCO|nr:CIC11C00000003510 [[Candida] intermedia]
MSYQPVDQIPLQDLSSVTTPDALEDEESEHSDTSEVFTEIDNYISKSSDLEDFLLDPTFQQTLLRFHGSRTLSKRMCSIITAAIFAVWLIALIVYSNGNARKVASGVLYGAATTQVLLLNRNITLNAFLANNANVTFDTYRRGMYFPDHKVIRWLTPIQFPEEGSSSHNGYYLATEGTEVVIRKANSDYRMILLENTVFEYKNDFFNLEDLVLNPGVLVDDTSAMHVLRSDITKQWRYSSYSLFWLWQPSTGNLFPIQPPGSASDSLEKLHFVEFSPSGEYLIFGHNQDLYAMNVDNQGIAVLTSSKDRNIFNGKPDWVYEEEIVGDEKMTWWSPDLKKMVFASIDDTDVEDYQFSFYVKSIDEIASSFDERDLNQYPVQAFLKYPKPGTNNPKVSLRVFDVDLQTVKNIEGLADEDVGEDFILSDATWIQDAMLLKLTDRTSTVLVKKLYLPKDENVKFVSKQDTSEYNGWVEKAQPIVAIQQNTVKYLEKVVVDNLVQLAVFDLADSETYSKLLGPIHYESAFAYDTNEKTVYGMWGTNNEVSFGLVSIEDGLKKTISENGKFLAYFSPDGNFVELYYDGPSEPWQKLINVADFGEEVDFDNYEPVNEVKSLSHTLAITNVPTRVQSKIKVGHGKEAVELNLIEIFPPNFDPNQKHPLLVNAYGGPGSTYVDAGFLIGFHEIVSSELNAVVLVIDPRGTGSDDWGLKQWAYKKLGYWEPRDLTSIVRDYIKINKYVEDERTAIWGWSYGGFTTLKTLEFDGGQVFKYGMAVAPVTNWMFYDSVYTERYMKSPESNENYQKISEISDFKKFLDVQRFLIMHGTADDNVHIQNTLWLVDHFDTEGVENYDMHFFPDSDHSIYYHNANTIVYDKLLKWLQKAFKGAYD